MTVVEILDSGPGMSPEILASLFGSAKTTKPGGAGLGLIIVRRLMLAHNGQVLIASGPSGTSIGLRFVHPESGA
jgi:signal transduction histidine kinase